MRCLTGDGKLYWIFKHNYYAGHRPLCLHNPPPEVDSSRLSGLQPHPQGVGAHSLSRGPQEVPPSRSVLTREPRRASLLGHWVLWPGHWVPWPILEPPWFQVKEPPVLFLKSPIFPVSGSKYLALIAANHQTPNYPKENPPTPLWRWRRAYWGATATLNAQWHLLI